MPKIREYLDQGNSSPFEEWFDDLSGAAAAKVTVNITRIGNGNYSNVEPVGEGVSEKKIDWGPGLRVYFGKDGEDLVILLGGSEKSDQAKMIRKAKESWVDYKARKRSKAHGTD